MHNKTLDAYTTIRIRKSNYTRVRELAHLYALENAAMLDKLVEDFLSRMSPGDKTRLDRVAAALAKQAQITRDLEDARRG